MVCIHHHSYFLSFSLQVEGKDRFSIKSTQLKVVSKLKTLYSYPHSITDMSEVRTYMYVYVLSYLKGMYPVSSKYASHQISPPSLGARFYWSMNTQVPILIKIQCRHTGGYIYAHPVPIFTVNVGTASWCRYPCIDLPVKCAWKKVQSSYEWIYMACTSTSL